MKKLLWVIGYGLAMLSLAGCATLQQMTRPAAQADTAGGAPPLAPYAGPKARIIVADFDLKAAKATGEVGSGLREMLATALINSNRFNVLERNKAADLIIAAAVSEFEPQASGGSAGMGGGGGAGSGILGGLLGANLNKAHIVLDIRIIDASTSKVLATTRVQGQASDIATGLMAGLFGRHGLAGGLSAYANTPMEKAIRICIIEAVRYIWQTIPANYYKY